MASDPSIYNNALASVVQPVNPLDQLQQGLQLQNALATQSAGKAFRASINPDGTTNQAKLLQNLAADPSTSAVAQQSAQAGQTLSTDEYAQHMTRLGYGANAGAQLLTAPGGPTYDAIKATYDRAVEDGHLTPQDEAHVLQGFGADPAANATIIKQRLLQNVGAQQALTAALPAAGSVDLGNVVQPTNTAPAIGATPNAVTPVGTAYRKGFAPTLLNNGGASVPLIDGQPANGMAPIPNTPSPDQANQLIKTFNPRTRQFEYTPRAAIAPMVDGSGNPAPGNQIVPGLPASGRVPQQPAPASPPTAGAPPVNAAPSNPSPPPQANIAEPGLGVADEAAASVTHLSAARDAANNYVQSITPLEKAEQALSVADTGKGAETLNNIRAYVQDLTPSAIQPFLFSSLTDTQKRTAFDEAKKYLGAVALGGPGASGSDARLGANQSANASVTIGNQAAQAVVRAAIAQKRLTQAGTLAFNQSGQDGSQYDRFMNSFNTQQDPVGYVADKMSPQERAAYVASIGGVGSAAYTRFKNSYKQGLATQVVPGG